MCPFQSHFVLSSDLRPLGLNPLSGLQFIHALMLPKPSAGLAASLNDIGHCPNARMARGTSKIRSASGVHLFGHTHFSGPGHLPSPLLESSSPRSSARFTSSQAGLFMGPSLISYFKMHFLFSSPAFCTGMSTPRNTTHSTCSFNSICPLFGSLLGP